MKLDSTEQCQKDIDGMKKIIEILKKLHKEVNEDMDKWEWEEQACKDMYHENA